MRSALLEGTAKYACRKQPHDATVPRPAGRDHIVLAKVAG